jgi:hypothetical protein
LDNILEDENELQSPRSGAMTNEKDSEPSTHPELTRESVPQTSGKLNPSVMTSNQLEGFLKQFYLIRTPYGYILGRHNPAISTTSITRRSMKPPKPRMKDQFGEF